MFAVAVLVRPPAAPLEMNSTDQCRRRTAAVDDLLPVFAANHADTDSIPVLRRHSSPTCCCSATTAGRDEVALVVPIRVGAIDLPGPEGDAAVVILDNQPDITRLQHSTGVARWCQLDTGSLRQTATSC